MVKAFLLLLLFAASCCSLAARGKGRGTRRLGRIHKTNMGNWKVATEPLHKTRCGDRDCRPGEGNLKGYEQWLQPYEPPPDPIVLLKRPPQSPDPQSAGYAPLLEVVRRVQQHPRNFVMFTAADFDYRELAENWFKAATRVGMTNAFV